MSISRAYLGTGARLAYVVVNLDGDVQRQVVTFNRKGKGLEKKLKSEPAGFLVYFPRGHVLRLRDKVSLAKYGLDRPANIINLQGLNNPNSPIGALLASQDDATRKGAFTTLEQQVIQLATAKTGPIVMPEQLNRAA